jgi:hypothetical protein
MATKLETLKYINDNYNSEPIGDNALKFVFEINGGRTQLVFAAVFDDVLLIDSPFATVDDVNANIAFKLAEESILGIRRVGDHYSVRHVVPLADVDGSEIDLGLQLAAEAADQLESEVGGDKF